MKVTREQLIERAMLEAIQTLEQIGCTYTITDHDGKVFSNEAQRKRRRSYSSLNITQRMVESSIGDSVFFKCPEDVDPLELQSAIAGHAYKVFGSGNYSTTIDRDRAGVTVLCGKKRGVDLSAAQLAEFAINNAARAVMDAEPQLL